MTARVIRLWNNTMRGSRPNLAEWTPTFQKALCSIQTFWGKLIITKRSQEFTHDYVSLHGKMKVTKRVDGHQPTAILLPVPVPASLSCHTRPLSPDYPTRCHGGWAACTSTQPRTNQNVRGQDVSTSHDHFQGNATFDTHFGVFLWLCKHKTVLLGDCIHQFSIRVHIKRMQSMHTQPPKQFYTLWLNCTLK